MKSNSKNQYYYNYGTLSIVFCFAKRNQRDRNKFALTIAVVKRSLIIVETVTQSHCLSMIRQLHSARTLSSDAVAQFVNGIQIFAAASQSVGVVVIASVRARSRPSASSSVRGQLRHSASTNCRNVLCRLEERVNALFIH